MSNPAADPTLLAYEWSTGCHALVDSVPPIYGYSPSLAPGVVFVVLFGLSTVVHTAQAIISRRWWTFLFVVGALVETMGWAARLWSVYCQYNTSAFLMQLATLVLAPTWLTAALYWILGLLIRHFGPQTSPLSSHAYLWIFCSCDLLSLFIQAAGGGIASGAISEYPPANPVKGTDVMVAGIVFQLASIIVFSILFILFVRRACLSDKYIFQIIIEIFATAFVVLLVLVRGIYRSIELGQGWTGYLINHQDYFIALDGSLMAAAFITFNLFHPAWFLQNYMDDTKVSQETEMSQLERERTREFVPIFENDNEDDRRDEKRGREVS